MIEENNLEKKRRLGKKLEKNHSKNVNLELGIKKSKVD